MMEGGGQLLRMATTYSAVLGEPIRVYNIRAGRKPPGLKPQHLKTLEAAAEISGADIKGGKINSDKIEFYPRHIKGGKFKYDIGTAGSISLFLQCVIPISAYAEEPVEINIRGGTAVKWSPPTSFLSHVVWKAFREMGLKCSLQIKRHGFYPKGGGEVSAIIKNNTYLKCFNPPYREIKTIRGKSICGKLPAHVAERQSKSASKQLLEEGFSTDIQIELLNGKAEPYSPGSVITLWTENMYLGSDSLGEKGKPAEIIGKEAALNLIRQIKTGAEVDLHTCDHLILPCSLAEGTSNFKTSKLTLHTLTAVKLAEIFTDVEVDINGTLGETAEITCKGIGLNRWQ
jgi:RNA 3'-terminal phosphate cyclase (ATP)